MTANIFWRHFLKVKPSVSSFSQRKLILINVNSEQTHLFEGLHRKWITLHQHATRAREDYKAFVNQTRLCTSTINKNVTSVRKDTHEMTLQILLSLKPTRPYCNKSLKVMERAINYQEGDNGCYREGKLIIKGGDSLISLFPKSSGWGWVPVIRLTLLRVALAITRHTAPEVWSHTGSYI